jgi:REP element-mobilizing transposase RayT
MTVHRLQEEKQEIFFCTITCYNWLHLFEITYFYDGIYKWFDVLKQKECSIKCSIIGYVIMPNHFHFMVYLPDIPVTLNKLVANGKRFMAYDIVSRLKIRQENKLLFLLCNAVSASERSKGKQHMVFSLSFDAKICYSEKMIEQKLDYMHHNPVTGKWNLVDDYTDYIHSSARFYELNEQGIYPVTHYKEIIGD